MYIDNRNLRGVQKFVEHQLCAGIVSVVIWCPRIVAPLVLWITIFYRYLKDIPHYDKEDYYQTGLITLWDNISRCEGNPDIALHFLSYYATSVEHAYIHIFRDFVMKNDVLIEVRSDEGDGYNISKIKSFHEYREKLRQKHKDRNMKLRAKKQKEELKKKKRRERDKAYYEANREKIIERNKANRLAHAEEIRIRNKARLQERREQEDYKIKPDPRKGTRGDYYKKYYEEHREEKMEKVRKYRMEHSEEIKERRRQRREQERQKRVYTEENRTDSQ